MFYVFPYTQTYDIAIYWLAKKFVRDFPYHLTEKPKRTFWPAQYFACKFSR